MEGSISANRARIVPDHTMKQRSQVLADHLSLLPSGARMKRRSRALARDRTLQRPIADLVAARTAAGMTQEAVARRMWTTKSAISRLESGVCTRPNLNAIQKYAFAIGARLEVRIETRP